MSRFKVTKCHVASRSCLHFHSSSDRQLCFAGAHGVAGILQVLAMCPDEVAAAHPDGPSALAQAISALIDSCHASGNLPSALGSSDDR